MIEAIRELSALAVATPIGVLVACLLIIIVHQERKLKSEREISRVLAREMYIVHALGQHEFSADASDTLDGLNRRRKNRKRIPDRRSE